MPKRFLYNGGHGEQILNGHKSRTQTCQQCVGTNIKYAKVSAFMIPETNAGVNCATRDVADSTPKLAKPIKPLVEFCKRLQCDNFELMNNLYPFVSYTYILECFNIVIVGL